MKKAILIAFALLMILSASLTACSSGGGPQGATPIQLPTPTKADPIPLPSPTQTQQSSGGGATWGSIPIYPGSEQVIKLTSDDETLNDKPAIMEHRTYSTGANVNDVGNWYKDKMLANGWDETMWAEIHLGFMGQYEKNGGNEIVVLGIAENSQNNGTVYNIDYKYVK